VPSKRGEKEKKERKKEGTRSSGCLFLYRLNSDLAFHFARYVARPKYGREGKINGRKRALYLSAKDSR